MDKIEIANEFLKKAIEDIKTQSKLHFDATNRQIHILGISETKSYSVLSPVFGKIGDYLIMECCVARTPENIGFLDYLLSYKNYLLAIEVKLAHIGLGKEIKENDGIFDDFSDALDQLNDMDLGKFKFLAEKAEGLIKMVLLVVVFSGQYATEKKRNERKRNLEKIQAKIKVEKDRLSQMIKDKFDKEVICYYMPFDEDMLYARGRRKLSKYGLYPGIAFIAHIYEE